MALPSASVVVVSGVSDASGAGSVSAKTTVAPSTGRPAPSVTAAIERLRQRLAHAAVLSIALHQRHGRRLTRAGQQQVAPAATGGQQEDSQYSGPADCDRLGVHDCSQVSGSVGLPTTRRLRAAPGMRHASGDGAEGLGAHAVVKVG